MAKNDLEFLLSLVSDGREKAPLFLEHVLNRGMKFIPDVRQTGLKRNQSLKAHIQNVVCFSYQLADLLSLEDEAKIQLIAAAYVHDFNKFPEYQGQSYGSIATEENVRSIVDQLLAESEDSFEINVDMVHRVVSLIRAHSGHHHVDGDGLFAARRDEKRDQMIGILRTADILDLSKDFGERDQKEKALRMLNGVIDDCQYEYTWHYFSDNRGIFTNFLHNCIVEICREQEAIPLLFYPEGVWYLIKKGASINVPPEIVIQKLKQSFARLSKEDTSKLLEARNIGFKFAENPLELELTAKEIVDLIVDQVMDRKQKKYDDKYHDLSKKCGRKCKAEYMKFVGKKEDRRTKLKTCKNNYNKLLQKTGLGADFTEDSATFKNMPPKKQEKIIKAKKAFLDGEMEVKLEKSFQGQKLWESEPTGLVSPDTDALRCGMFVGSMVYVLIEYVGFKSEDAWQWASESAGLRYDEYPEIRFFDKQSDRGYGIGTVLYEKGITLADAATRLKAPLGRLLAQSAQEKAPQRDNTDTEMLDYISTNLKTPGSPLRPSMNTLQEYSKSNHKQCCYCSGGVGKKWMKKDLPANIKAQKFSNRLKAAADASKVKRNVCEICRQSFYLEKLLHESYTKQYYYMHLFTDGGEYRSHAEPSIFLDLLKQGVQKILDVDNRAFLIRTDSHIRDYLAKNPTSLSGNFGKQIGMLLPKYPWNIGGQITYSVNTPTKNENDSTRFAFALGYFLIITRCFNLRGILSRSPVPPLKPQEFGKLYLDHIPITFKALIPNCDIDSEHAEVLWRRFTCLHGLRNIYKVQTDKKDYGKELVKLIDVLYDRTGLDLIHRLRKSFSSSKKTKERKEKPWKEAWPLLQPFLQEDYLMPIKKLAQIALDNHFHGESWKDTSQAKPLDLAFDVLSKFDSRRESEEDLKMIMLHKVTKGLESVSKYDFGKEKRAKVHEFVETFFNELLTERYKGDKTAIEKNRNRIRSAFLAYLTVLRKQD